MKKRRIKITACFLTLVFIASQFSGCHFKETVTVLKPYEVAYEGNAGLMDMQKVSGFASGLCVVSDEREYRDNQLNAEAALVFNITDRTVLFSKNAYERLYPASITKLMTALIAVKYGNLSDMVTVPEEAKIDVPGASLCGLEPGDQISMEDLLYGALLPSGNDACAAIAVHMSGSIEAFADTMNQEAAALGATGTHFVNPHGLSDENHYTTAYDIYLILNEVSKYDKFMEIFTTRSREVSYTKADGSPTSAVYSISCWYFTGNTEAPEGVIPLGGKTGTTTPAKYCLALLSQDAEGKQYISVVLKAKNRQALYQNMNRLLEKIYP